MSEVLIKNMSFKDVNPLCAGWEDCTPSHSYGYHIRDYYILHYVSTGKGVLYKNNKKYPVRSGQVFLIKPGEVTKYTADKIDPWHYIWIGGTGKMVDKLADMPAVFDVNGSIFKQIKNCESYINMRESYLAGCLFHILCEIFESSATTDSVMAVENYIDSNYMNNPKIVDIAQNLNLNRKYLARLFKKKTGVTMQEYITNRKMEAAKRLLSSGYNVNETAQMIGYCDQSSFSRAFKNHFGASPSQTHI